MIEIALEKGKCSILLNKKDCRITLYFNIIENNAAKMLHKMLRFFHKMQHFNHAQTAIYQ